MTQKNLTLPFIITTQENGNLTFPAELAYAACMAELQRKKTGFLRDTPEKLAFLSKTHYPLWIIPVEDSCIVLDGLGLATHKFTFKEPSQTGVFIEELEKNSQNPQEFANALENQTRKIREFTSPTSVSFGAVIADKELLSFLLEYLKKASSPNMSEEKNQPIPPEIDETTAAETSHAISNCLRTLQADAKGLQYALDTLNEEAEFHKEAANREIEKLKETCDAETAKLRPQVDKKVKALTAKRDKNLATAARTTDKKTATAERKRDSYLRKLQVAERRKDAAEKRKKSKSKSAYGSYEVDKRNREINNIKKQLRDISEDLDRIKKEAENNTRRIEEEFRNAAAQEESRITQLKTACDAKVAQKKEQIDKMTSQTATITLNFHNLMDELKHDGNALREQVEINWKTDSPDETVLAQIPVYIAKYAAKGDNERYALFSPTVLSEDTSVMGELRKMLTLSSEPKLKTLTRQANKRLHDMLTANVIDKMQNDEVYRTKINAVCRTNNLLDRMDFAETLNEGLDELVKRGWMTAQEAQASCSQITRQET